MSNKLPFYLLFAVLVAAAAVVTAESIESLPADAGSRGVTVQLEDGSVRTVDVDAGPDESLAEVDGKVPGVPLGWAKNGGPRPESVAASQPRPDQPETGQPQTPAPGSQPQPGSQPSRARSHRPDPSFSLPTRLPLSLCRRRPQEPRPPSLSRSRRARPPLHPLPSHPRRPPTPARVLASPPPSRRARPSSRRAGIDVPPSDLAARVRARAAARRPRSASRHARARSFVTLMVRRLLRIRGLWMRCRGRRFGLGCRIS